MEDNKEVNFCVSDLSKNRFGEVPTEVCDYCNMERLNCYHNIIKSIPDAIVQLQSLTHLNLWSVHTYFIVFNVIIFISVPVGIVFKYSVSVIA